MRVLIVDDEAAARRRLDLMLEELDVELVGKAGNGVEALELIEQLQPDVVLLDISMPEVDGFDVARHLPEPAPLIIFQTAYHEHALEAFDHDAVDYVVKPVKLERLARALERARKRLHERRERLSEDVLDRLETVLSPTASQRRARLLVREGSGHRLVPLMDILEFVAEGGVTRAVTADRRYLADYSLSQLEARAGDDFFRANRSELVNLEHVTGIRSDGDGSVTATLTSGATVHISRRRAARFKESLEG